MELMIQKTLLLKPEFSEKVAINILSSYNDLRENLKIKQKFFIGRRVQMAHETAVSEQSRYYPLQSFLNKWRKKAAKPYGTYIMK